MRNRMIGKAAVCLGAFIAAAGCSQQTIQSAQQDTQHNAAVLNKDVQQAAQKLKPALDKLDLGARVTAALNANANLPHTIRVDADVKGVRLRGQVDTAAQKKLAGQIAQQTVPNGKTVANQLTVKGQG